MTVINSNISSLRAANASTMASKSLATSMERLSTGKRINSAKDDAAGLAIASRMSSQIKSMNVAVRNANDGISMAQTAEGALSEVTNMLQRMKELATQSANGTLGASDRKALQAEVTQLTSQINDIAKTTNFNGLNLLDGSVKGLKLQTGTNAGDTVSLSMDGVSSDKLGLTNDAGAVTSGRVTGATLTGAITINGVEAVAAGAAVSATDSAADLASKINANSSKTGVVATASNSVTFTVPQGTTSFSAGKINDIDIGSAATASDLVQNINTNSAKLGVSATLNDDGSITLANDTGKAIKTENSAFGAVATNQGFVSLSSKDGSQFSVDVDPADASNLGLNDYSGVGFAGNAVNTTNNTALTANSLEINGVKIGAATGGTGAAGNAASYVDAINAAEKDTGVRASNTGGVITLSSVNGGAVRVGGAGATTIGFAAQGGVAGMSSQLDISSQSGASAAMSKIDAALDKISATRGDLGAVQNRLEVTVNNLTTTSTNLSDAKSRIEDTDFSTETTSLAKAQILSQASTAMLAQANQSAQGVLKLLG